MQVRQYLFVHLHQIAVSEVHLHQIPTLSRPAPLGYGSAVGQLRISVQPATDADFAGAEELLERLDLPDEALANLCRLARLDEAPFRESDGWSARIELDRTPLCVRAREGRWTIYAAPGAEDAMEAARRLHGLIGGSPEQDDGWDLDR
jgi:hypothetical protein